MRTKQQRDKHEQNIRIFSIFIVHNSYQKRPFRLHDRNKINDQFPFSSLHSPPQYSLSTTTRITSLLVADNSNGYPFVTPLRNADERKLCVINFIFSEYPIDSRIWSSQCSKQIDSKKKIKTSSNIRFKQKPVISLSKKTFNHTLVFPSRNKKKRHPQDFQEIKFFWNHKTTVTFSTLQD